MATGTSIKEKVIAYLAKPENSIFKWGVKDCALFANDMVVEVFGFKDVGAAFRGFYATEMGAAKQIVKLGYKNVADVAEKHLLLVEQPQAGDIVLHPSTESLGVCSGDYCYFLQEHGGLKRVLNSKVKKAWRVVCQQ